MTETFEPEGDIINALKLLFSTSPRDGSLVEVSGKPTELFIYHQATLSMHPSEFRQLATSGEITPSICSSSEHTGVTAVRLVKGALLERSLGTIMLGVDLPAILNNRHIYAVEFSPYFGNGRLHRLIVSDRLIPEKAGFKVDPAKHNEKIVQTEDGLWKIAAEFDYEFLITFPIKFSNTKILGLSSHKEPFCLKYGDACREANSEQAVCEIFALAIASPNLLELRKLLREATFLVGSPLLVPFAIQLRSIDKERTTTKYEPVSREEIQAAFLQMGMGNWSQATAMLKNIDRKQIDDYLLTELEELVGEPCKPCWAFIK